MSLGETPISIVGNLTADPEIKFTTGGAALAKFTIAATPRVFDRESNQWKDGTSTFFRCSAWRRLAEHIAESLTKGSHVVAFGRIRQHNWETPEGENRSMLAVEVDEIGASLRFTTVAINGKTAAKAGASSDAWATDGASADAKFSEKPPF
ncbi:single-stranded DNA-binding protein [Streptomyces sp. NBC_01381]|uniref:single-stranded DNA-binding protein n=1 Tax=unclassified Streptomyces TaxID=2593676 RepID=UPI002251649C|nr:single-stranded DNA-binding protein [Streptomyces sp. NBC_01381]MCX4665118.1 single-stranded DNA-binding protein [Streptomyces sp. NBC_01381]